jgi:amidase
LHFDLRRYNTALNQRDHLIAALEHFLEDWDILLCPVVVLPTYAPDGSQPVGLQWIGRRWQDEALLDRCALADALLGGFRAPPGFS